MLNDNSEPSQHHLFLQAMTLVELDQQSRQLTHKNKELVAKLQTLEVSGALKHPRVVDCNYILSSSNV